MTLIKYNSNLLYLLNFERLLLNLNLTTFFLKKGLKTQNRAFSKLLLKILPIGVNSTSQENTFLQKYSFFCKKGIFLKKRMYNSFSVDSAIFGIFAKSYGLAGKQN